MFSSNYRAAHGIWRKTYNSPSFGTVSIQNSPPPRHRAAPAPTAGCMFSSNAPSLLKLDFFPLLSPEQFLYRLRTCQTNIWEK